MVRPPAYQKASAWAGWWVLILLLGVGAQMLITAVLTTAGWAKGLGLWMILIGAAPVVVSIWIGIKGMAKATRERIARVQTRLGVLGFFGDPKPTQDARTNFCAPIAHLLPYLGLNTGAAGVQWYATDAAGKLLIFEHLFRTGTGKSTQIFNHTVVIWPAGHPDVGNATLPRMKWFVMGRFAWLKRRVYRKHELHDAAFADLIREWCLTGDIATGLQFLTPAVRSELGRAPKGEAWYIGVGWMCYVFNGTLDGDNVDGFLQHGRAVVGRGQ